MWSFVFYIKSYDRKKPQRQVKWLFINDGTKKNAAGIKTRIVMILHFEHLSAGGVGISFSAFRTWPSKLSLALW